MTVDEIYEEVLGVMKQGLVEEQMQASMVLKGVSSV